MLALALAARAGTFALPHQEGDERIYAALYDQVRSGHGYTLQGHPILAQDGIIAEQYDVPLFYHPPGALLWVAPFERLFGPRGWDVATLAAFAIFVAAMGALAGELLPDFPPRVAWSVAVLAGFTPIVAHVSMHRWLEMPQLAALTVACWLLVRAVRGGSTATAVAAGVMLGLALLVKLNAAIAIPGLFAVAWAAGGERPRARWSTLAIALAGAAACVAPWLVAEARTYGTIFPAWAGRPSARLVAENPFVHQVTAVRTPWAYLRLLPQTVWTLGPAFGLVVVARPRGTPGRIAWASIVWIASVVGAQIALGFLGYSKLLRYVVLITPAAILLAAVAVREILHVAPVRVRVLGGCLALAIALEAAQGVQVLRVYPDRAWIRPLFGQAR